MKVSTTVTKQLLTILLILGIFRLPNSPCFAQELKVTLKGHTYDVMSVAFSPDGKYLVSGSLDNTIRVWNLRTSKVITTLKCDKHVLSVACSPDGKLLASALGDFLGGEILLWNRAKGKVESRLLGHTDTVDSVVFSPNGKILASASWDETIKLWDVTAAKLKSTFKGCAPIAFSPDGKTLASGSELFQSRGIRLWDLRAGRLKRTLKSHNQLLSIAFNPNGKILASGGCDWDKTIELWNPTTGKLKLIYKRPTSLINCVAFSPDGKTLASSSDRNTVHVWEALTGKLKATFKGKQDCAMSVVFSPDGRTLAFASGKTIELWDVSKLK